MDITPFLDLKIAPRAVFDDLASKQTRVRFMVSERQDWRAVTWKAYANQIRCIGLYLLNAGLKNGERAAIFAPNRVEWISSALAIQAVGGVMVPIYPNSTADQVGYVVRHSDSRHLFVDTEMLLGTVFEAWEELDPATQIILLDESLDPVKVLHDLRSKGKGVPSYSDIYSRLISFEDALEIGRALHTEDPEAFGRAMDSVSLEQPGLMLYTSGTTGKPKGVPLTHRNIAVNGRDWLRCNAPVIDENAVDILWLPMSHIFGFGEACLGNTLGFTTYLSDPVQVLDHLPSVRPSVFMSVPRYFEKIAQRVAESDESRRAEAIEKVTGGRLKFCLSGGAGLKREVKEFFHENGILIIEGYGLTEASPTLTLNRPDSFRFDSVGKPLPSVQIKLAEDGEILARGESIFSGYHKNPSATQETFTSDGWLKTGDLGRFTDDGFLQIIGRKKEILVTAGGKNISPVKIESAFMDDPYFAHVVVYGDSEKYLVAGVWPNTEAIRSRIDDADTDLKPFLKPRVDRVNATLPSYQTIKDFEIFEEPLTVENGFLTPTLKVKRKKVYEAFGDRLRALYER